MPVKVKDSLPAVKILEEENIFMMSDTRATTQDIRPLRIIILNLMPTKIVTETQLLRRISNTPLQIEVTFLRTSTYQSHNTTQDHLDAFYKTFEDIQDEKFDGLIITGAPVEHFEFEEVTYWKEITHIMDWANTHVFSTLYICWAAQAGLFYKYGVPKYPLEKKMFGVFLHRTMNSHSPITRGFDDVFYAPHSRHTEVRQSDIEKNPDLEILALSEIAGVYLVASRDGRHVFVTGHGEYDFDTLKLEYERDLSKGLPIEIPVNYFPDDDPSKEPVVTWRSHSNLLISNWLNYCVYQQTPFNLDEL